jgi:hypothetical protein
VDRRLAVAVSFAPTATEAGNACENVACPALLVVNGVEPMNTAPSPYPDGSHEGLEKNSIVNWPEEEVSSVPCTVTAEPVVVADWSTGKFCRPLPPVSPSPGSLGVMPPTPPKLPEKRSIPRAPQSWMELPVIVMPFSWLPTITPVVSTLAMWLELMSVPNA